MCRLALCTLLVALAVPVDAQDVTIATFNCEFLVRREVERKFERATPPIDEDDARWDDDAFRAARFREAAEHVAAVLLQTNADVLALTEVGTEADVDTLAAVLADLGAPYPHRFVGHSTDVTTGQHVAVLSRLPLSDGRDRIPGRERFLREPDDPDTEDDTGLSKALRVTVDALGHPLLLYVAHLRAESGSDTYGADAQRLAQAALLRRHMLPALLGDSLVVVAGDLNDHRGQPPLRRLRGLDDLFPDLIQTGLCTPFERGRRDECYFAEADVGERWTYEFNGERQQIDHVLLSEAVDDATDAIEAWTLDHGDPLASDHRPFVVTLRFDD